MSASFQSRRRCTIEAIAVVAAALIVAMTSVPSTAAEPPGSSPLGSGGQTSPAPSGPAAPAPGRHAAPAPGSHAAPKQAARAEPVCPDQPEMTFTSWTNPVSRAFGLGSREYIFADGYICSDTARKFKQFLPQHPPKPDTTVVLNSGGGDLGVGMDLGEVIRQHKMWTEIGSFLPVIIPRSPNIKPQTVPYISEPETPPFPGACYSACNFAFMGGVRRTMSFGSNFGVHQFESAANAPNNDLQNQTERVSAAIVAFLNEMGISPNWMVYMVKKRGNDVTDLTMTQMRNLKVVTPRWQTKWQIEPRADKSGFALVGTTSDDWGTQLLAFTCGAQKPPGQQHAQSGQAATHAQGPGLTATFTLDPGARGKAQDLVGAVAGYSIALSGEFVPEVLTVKQAPPLKVANNRLVLTLPLAPGIISRITKIDIPDSGVVALIFKPAAKLPMRLLPFEASLDGPMLKQFVATCH